MEPVRTRFMPQTRKDVPGTETWYYREGKKTGQEDKGKGRKIRK